MKPINLKKINEMGTKEIIEKTIERLKRKIDKQKIKCNWQNADDLTESVQALESCLNVIFLNNAEIRSKFNRFQWAEGLILQLPDDHEGRNSWLLNYGIKDEAISLRKSNNLYFHEDTMSCELTS